MDHENTKLEAAQKPSEKDQPTAKEPGPSHSDQEPENETSSQPQYDSFMRIIRR